MRGLGHLESTIMAWLWDHPDPASVRDVLEGIRGERDLAYTTVMTVLDHLHRKSLVTRQRDGRAYRYRPVATREQHTAALMEDVLASAGDRSAALLHFVERMDDDDSARLRAVLERHHDADRGHE